MADNSFDFMKDVLAAPLGELISSIGQGVAEAQAALDAGSLAQTLALNDLDNKDEMSALLRSVGYQPTFYAIPETEVEAQVTLSLSMTGGYNTNFGLQKGSLSKTKIYVAPANASHNNTYNLNVNAFSKIKFKIVPVPPPNNSADIRVVPNLKDKTIAEVETILAQLGLAYKIINEPATKTNPATTPTKIKSQIPLPGEFMNTNNVIEITL
jgi:PASTA domain